MTKQEIMPMSLCDNSINKLTFNNCIQLKLCQKRRQKSHLNEIHFPRDPSRSDYNGQSRQCWMQ